MSERLDNIIPDFSDLSLESIWEKYSGTAPAPSSAPSSPTAPEAPAEPTAAPAVPSSGSASSAGSIAERSRRIVMNALGETLRQYRQSPHTAEPVFSKDAGEDITREFAFASAVVSASAAGPDNSEPPAEEPARKDISPIDSPGVSEPVLPETDAAAEIPVHGPSDEELAPSQSTAPAEEPLPEKQHPKVSIGPDGIITLLYGPIPDGDGSDESDAFEESTEDDIPADTSSEESVPEETEAAPESETPGAIPISSANNRPRPQSTGRQKASRGKKKSRGRTALSEKLLTPAVHFVAAQLAKRQQQKKEASAWPEPEAFSETPELSPRNAARYYAARSGELQLRLRASLLLTVIASWIALGLPMSARLTQSLPLQAGVSLILTLAVMVAALDVVTAGLRQLLELAPGPEALSSLAAVLSCIDAALTLLGYGTAMPFCAVGVAALTAALWGERLRCRALMRTFRTAASSKEPSYMAVNPGDEKEPARLFRTETPVSAGIVRRSEQNDICRTAYAAAAPFLILAAFLFSLIASVSAGGQYFLHTFSALVSVSASFAAFFGFSLPWSVAARRLRSSGAAIAGYAGCADIAQAKEIVVTDGDLFPPGTMRFSSINVLEDIPQHKVIIAAASLIFSSGSGASALFEELVERRGYNVPEPREYSIHESGGLSGIVNGEHADVGPARFMNLQGIRLPRNLSAKNAVCVALSGELVGVFQIEYTPFTSVQDALVTLLRGRAAPLFAVRDFNITPKMIHDLFKLPSTNFHFPSYRERSRIRTDAETPVDAVITRKGMLPYVESAEAGRRLHSTSRIVTILSLIGSSIGMVILFLLCRTGAFDTASVGNALSFMLLWALPAVILSYNGGK